MTEFSAKILEAWESDEAAYVAAHALRSLQDNVHVYAVGGVCRDAVLGVKSNDVDLLVTNIEASVVQEILDALPGWSDVTGKDFGVFRYKQGDRDCQISLPRRERSTGPLHTDFEVDADPRIPLEEDLSRRDFTCNAMAFNLFNHTLSDPHKGREDAENRIIRAISENSFVDDPLRIMRGVVLHARFNFVTAGDTFKMMAANAPLLKDVSGERIQWELDKIFESDNPAGAMKMMKAANVLPVVFPEFEASINYDQNNPHHMRMLDDHMISVLEVICEKTKDKDLRLAAFLHDIGKPVSAWVDPVTGSNHFYAKRYNKNDISPAKFDHNVRWINDSEFEVGYQHEEVGAINAVALMSRLHYPVARTNRVYALVRNHMWAPFTSLKGARRFLNMYGEHADDLLTLRWADQGGKSIYPATPEHNLDDQAELIAQVQLQDQPTKQADLAINGHDLMDVGIPQGPIIGEILEHLTNEVIDDPMQNDKEILLVKAENYWDGRLHAMEAPV